LKGTNDEGEIGLKENLLTCKKGRGKSKIEEHEKNYRGAYQQKEFCKLIAEEKAISLNKGREGKREEVSNQCSEQRRLPSSHKGMSICLQERESRGKSGRPMKMGEPKQRRH